MKTITIADKQYTLRYRYRDIERLHLAFETDGVDMGKSLTQAVPTISSVKRLLWAGLLHEKPNFTMVDSGRLVNTYCRENPEDTDSFNQAKLVELRLIVLGAYLTDIGIRPDGEKEESQPGPEEDKDPKNGLPAG